MKREYKGLEMELVYFDTGNEVHTCELIGDCPEVACFTFGCRIDGIPICKCDNDIIHASGI